MPLDECNTVSASYSYLYRCNDSLYSNLSLDSDYYDYYDYYEQLLVVTRYEFNSSNCSGNLSAVSDEEFQGEMQCGSQCDVMQLRQSMDCALDSNSTQAVPPVLIDSCYVDDVDYMSSFRYFCGKLSDNHTAYWLIHSYSSLECEPEKLQQAIYHTNGCWSDHFLNPFGGYTQLIRCDEPLSGDAFTDDIPQPDEQHNGACGNYWIPALDFYAFYEEDEYIPFDECISRSFANFSVLSSYKFVCNASSSKDGVIFKQTYNTSFCQGDSDMQVYTEMDAKYIDCNASNACDILRVTNYEIPMSDVDFYELELELEELAQDDTCSQLAAKLWQFDVYDFEETVVAFPSCVQTEEGRASSTGCSNYHGYTFAKQYNGDVCDDAQINSFRYTFLRPYECDVDIGLFAGNSLNIVSNECVSRRHNESGTEYQYEYENHYEYDSYEYEDDAELSSTSVVSTVASSRLHGDEEMTKEKSSMWAHTLIAISTAILLLVGLVILGTLCYRRYKRSAYRTHDGMELLQLVTE